MSEREVPLGFFSYLDDKDIRYPYIGFSVENKTNLPIKLDLYWEGYQAEGFVQIFDSNLVIAPSAITKVKISVDIPKLSFWKKLKWLLRR